MGQDGCSRTLTLSGTCTPNPQPQAPNPDPKQDASALWFLKTLFPCHRLVFSERPGNWESHFADYRSTRPRASQFPPRLF